MAVSFQTRGFALCSELWAREMVIFISQLQDPRSQSKRRLAKPSGIGVGSWAWNLAVLTPCPALILSCRLPPGHRGAWASHFSIQACVGDSAVTAELGPCALESPHFHSVLLPQPTCPFSPSSGEHVAQVGHTLSLCPLHSRSGADSPPSWPMTPRRK